MQDLQEKRKIDAAQVKADSRKDKKQIENVKIFEQSEKSIDSFKPTIDQKLKKLIKSCKILSKLLK